MLACLAASFFVSSIGCRTVNAKKLPPAPPPDVPRELSKVALPPYVIEPPDILLIDAIKVVPRAPYHIEALDALQITVLGAYPEHPIAGAYLVEPGGTVDLGPVYGRVPVAGLTVDAAATAITGQLKQLLNDPETSVGLAEAAGKQQIAGEHLVGQDGTVTLGTYGSVFVTGMTREQARSTIEKHLSRFLESPEVSVDVYAYNSKVYYVIIEGAGLGDQITSFPITGNETVLDALARVNGLQSVSSKTIWIARPAPAGIGCEQILPVDYKHIARGGGTDTNYQILPGDRVFIKEDKLVATDTMIAKITSPAERVLGFALLGGQTVRLFRFFKGFGFATTTPVVR